MTDFRSSALLYVRHVLDTLGETPSSLARRSGLSTTTLTRPIHDQNYKFSISSNTLEKIKAATGIDYGPFLGSDASNMPHLHTQVLNRSGISFERIDIEDERSQAEYTTAVVGAAQSGHWIEGRHLEKTRYFIPLVYKDQISDPENYVGYFLKDENIDKKIPPGTVLLCQRRDKDAGGKGIGVGSFAILKRQKGGTDLFEISARMCISNDDDSLVFSNYRKSGYDGERIALAGEGDDTVTVLATVLFGVQVAHVVNMVGAYEDALAQFLG